MPRGALFSHGLTVQPRPGLVTDCWLPADGLHLVPRLGGLPSVDPKCRLVGESSSNVFGEGNGSPLQGSCLENPRDRGAWWAAVHGVTKSQKRLKRLSRSSQQCITKGMGELTEGSDCFQRVCSLAGSRHACSLTLHHRRSQRWPWGKDGFRFLEAGIPADHRCTPSS